MELWPGKPYPLGATWDGNGVNFAVFSENATGVDLCLFAEASAASESQRIPLIEATFNVWHGYVPGIGPGQVYGYRVHGAYAPEQGHRFNPSKLLLDPYGRAIAGKFNVEAPLLGYIPGHPDADLSYDQRDNAWGMPKSVVVDTSFDWGDDSAPNTPLHRSVIYEVHVKGFTQRHPDIAEHWRGTYLGLASPPAIEHLQRLGVTAVELLPVHAIAEDAWLVEKGLSNYWGYNTIGFFAPEARYCSSGDCGQQVTEFKTMVKALHQAGLEVILDVVYNHSGEGNHLGPTYCFRGLDNATYYRLVPGNPRYYYDYTGTGNSLNINHPQVLKMIMDSLRYWVLEMHVDGFRFDLATVLGRGQREMQRNSAFFDVIHQDPVLSQVKLIAEPWDAADGGYQVGNFPVLWAEWNGKYRDAVRRYWRGEDCVLSEMAYRLTGSSDLYQDDGRRPFASINFVTCHDGFTLQDLVSYSNKHNEANGEGNKDGLNDNLSCNCGVEGPTVDEAIVDLRERQKRNFLATLLLSQGVPMICGGDEMGRSQSGNNNAYCQDNEISWFDWNLDDRDRGLLEFTRRLVALRHEQPALQRRKFFLGRGIKGSDVKDATWLGVDGQELKAEHWKRCGRGQIALLLAGEALNECDEQGQPVVGDTLLIMINCHAHAVAFALPHSDTRDEWQPLIDTSKPNLEPGSQRIKAGSKYELAGRSLVLLKRQCPTPAA